MFLLVRGSAAVYTPILKGKAGEFEALRHVSPDVRSAIRPIIELVPDDEGHINLDQMLRVINRSIPSGLLISLDFTYVRDGSASLLSGVAEHLCLAGIPLRPLVRSDDSSEALGAARDASRLHGRGACLRMGTLEEDPSTDEVEERLSDVLAGLGLEAEQVDLLIDFREVLSQRDVDRVAPAARKLLKWSENRPWRSVTLAAGGFPESIAGLDRDAVTAVPRYDAMLWKSVTQSVNSLPVWFGDYGIANPAPVKRVPHPSMPNLRYTAGLNWMVYRQASPREAGNERFYELCTALVGSSHWMGPQYSWGDERLDRCASRSITPGNASKWRAYGTSHHLAVVTDRLASLGEP